jgi:hypothetical protein
MRRTAVRARPVAVVAVVLLGLAGCDALTGNKEKSISLTVDDAAFAVGQGSRDSATITVTRSNFDKPVTLSVEGALPTGVSATFSVNPLQGAAATSKLRIIASPTATPGSVTVAVRAQGEGIADKGLPIDVTVSVTGTYTLGMLAPTLTVAQGGGGEATVLLTRSAGNQSSVALTATGAPAGVTVTVQSPSSDQGTTLAVTATASAVPGTYPITITGSAEGITPNQTTQLSLVVVAPQPTTNVVVPFCSNGVPIWFAFQNEGFGWQRVLPTGSTFSFAATQKVAIAYTRQFGTEFETAIFFMSLGELSGFSDRDCDGPRTLTGTVTGLTAGQSAVVVMGSNSAATTGSNYTLQGVPARPMDLVATRGTRSAEGFLVPDRLIVRRSLDLTSTIPQLDFTAVEAFAPGSNSLTVTGFASGFALEFQNTLWTATATYGVVHSGVAAGGSSTLFAVPAAQLAAGEMHELFVDSYKPDGTEGQQAVSYYGAPADRNEALGPLMSTAQASTTTTSPYARLRGQLPSQAEYGTAAQFVFIQGNPGSRRVVILVSTSPYNGGRPTTWDVLIPDFSGVSGFTTSWMPPTGQSVPYYAQAFAARPEVLFGAIPAIGETIKVAYRISATSTSLRAFAAQAVRERRAPIVTQYLRR